MDFAIGLLGLLGLLFVFEAIDHWSEDENSTNENNNKKHWWSLSGEKTSGLRVYKDHATGVQYIKSTFFERMQVRINKDGTPYTGE